MNKHFNSSGDKEKVNKIVCDYARLGIASGHAFLYIYLSISKDFIAFFGQNF